MVKTIQSRTDDITTRMSELLRIERDSGKEFSQEELDVVPMSDETSYLSKAIKFLVTHG